MKISEKTQLGLQITEFIKGGIIGSLNNVNSNSFVKTEDLDGFKKRMVLLLDDNDNNNYLITETVQNMIKKLKLPNNFDPVIFNKIPKQKRTLLLGKTSFYKYLFYDENTILCCYFEYNLETNYLNYTTFTINILTGQIGVNDLTDKATSEIINTFCKIITFIDLAEIEITYLKPNQVMGTKKFGKTKNETKYNIIIIDSSWNKYVIRTEGFSVSGHFRFQPCGVKLLNRKIIWIDTYEKHGYIRFSKKKFT